MGKWTQRTQLGQPHLGVRHGEEVGPEEAVLLVRGVAAQVAFINSLLEKANFETSFSLDRLKG
jgi:hypothetical protein